MYPSTPENFPSIRNSYYQSSPVGSYPVTPGSYPSSPDSYPPSPVGSTYSSLFYPRTPNGSSPLATSYHNTQPLPPINTHSLPHHSQYSSPSSTSYPSSSAYQPNWNGTHDNMASQNQQSYPHKRKVYQNLLYVFNDKHFIFYDPYPSS